MSQLETVTIKCPENTRSGAAVINKDDFDPEVHELFDAPAKPSKSGEGASEPKPIADVIAMASDSQVQFMAFKAEAVKILGDGAPAKKAELVEALEAKARETAESA